MLTHEGTVGIAPALTAVAVIAAISGSLWWKTREEPQASAVILPSPVAEEAAPATPPPPRAVVAFLGFADAQATLPADDHASEGLQQLAAALAARGGNLLWRDRALRLEEAAARLERDPDPLAQADIARDAFVQAAQWVAQLESDAGAALEAARGIDTTVPLAVQAEGVSRFFEDAAAALRPAAPDENRA